MKTSAATTPTKIAAIRSMVSMKRSAKRGGLRASRNSGLGGIVSDIIALDATTAAKPPPSSPSDCGAHQYEALYWASVAVRSFQIASGSPPAFFTSSAHFCFSGSADFFHSSSWAGVMV